NDDGASTFLLTTTYFPSANGSGFLRAGIGPTSFHGEKIIDGPTEQGDGMAVMLGVGSELQIENGPAITPLITALYSDVGKTHLSMSPDRNGVKAWILTFGVGLTWH